MQPGEVVARNSHLHFFVVSNPGGESPSLFRQRESGACIASLRAQIRFVGMKIDSLKTEASKEMAHKRDDRVGAVSMPPVRLFA